MIHINQQVVPPGGWHFFDLGIRLSADSYEELYKVVLRFRLQNRAPIETIQEEINRYIAGLSPSHVIRVTPPPTTPKKKGLGDRVYDWACSTYSNWTPSRRKAPMPDAERRAEVCLACPKNLRYRSGCPACVSQTHRLLTALRDGRHSRREQDLGGCDVLGLDTATAILLEDDTIGPKVSNNALPKNCWLKA